MIVLIVVLIYGVMTFLAKASAPYTWEYVQSREYISLEKTTSNSEYLYPHQGGKFIENISLVDSYADETSKMELPKFYGYFDMIQNFNGLMDYIPTIECQYSNEAV